MGHDIGFIESFQILPIESMIWRKEFRRIELFEVINYTFEYATLYYSIDNKYDVTNSLQRQFNKSNTGGVVPVDDRFWWNKYLTHKI